MKLVIKIVVLTLCLYNNSYAGTWVKITNSAKNPAASGKCVAGAEIASGGCRWVRINPTQKTTKCTTGCTWKYIQP